MRATDRRWRLALAVAGIAALAAQVLAQNFEVDTHTLKNGMKILVQEDHTIPSVAMYIFYRIGCATKAVFLDFAFLGTHDVQWREEIWARRV